MNPLPLASTIAFLALKVFLIHMAATAIVHSCFSLHLQLTFEAGTLRLFRSVGSSAGFSATPPDAGGFDAGYSNASASDANYYNAGTSEAIKAHNRGLAHVQKSV